MRAAADRSSDFPRRAPYTDNTVRHAVAYAFVGSCCINGSGLVMPLFGMTIYDKVIPHGAFDTLAAMVVVALVLVALEWAARVARACILDDLADHLADEAQGGAFESLLTARADSAPASSGSASAILRDGDDVRSGFASSAASVSADALFAPMYIAALVLFGGWIAGVAIVASAALAGVAWLAWRRQDALRVPVSRAGSLRHGVLAETTRAVWTLRRWSLQAQRRILWASVSEQHARTAQAARRNSTRVSTVQSAAQNGAMIAALAIGTPAAVEGAISVGALVACVILTTRTVATAASLAATVPRMATARQAQLSASRMAALPREDGAHAVRLAPGPGALHIEALTVRYPDGELPVLKDLTLGLEAGQRVAITGASGSGKTSLERAVFGEIRPESGRIRLDGIDIDFVERASLRQAIVGVPQIIDVLAGTLRDNVDLGRGIDDARIDAALRSLGPAGRSLLATGYRLDRPISEAGRGLSGGQMQAIALARVLVDETARLAILDEPTTGLDTESEGAALRALRAWLGSRTLIVLTHRATVASALAEGMLILAEGRLHLSGSRTSAARSP